MGTRRKMIHLADKRDRCNDLLLSVTYLIFLVEICNLRSTHHSSGGPAAHCERWGRESEDTSRSGKGLRPLHPWFRVDLRYNSSGVSSGKTKKPDDSCIIVINKIDITLEE